MPSSPTKVPKTRERFRGAIAGAANLEVAAGVCDAIHKAEVKDLLEDLRSFVQVSYLDDFDSVTAEFLD